MRTAKVIIISRVRNPLRNGQLCEIGKPETLPARMAANLIKTGDAKPMNEQEEKRGKLRTNTEQS